jgi:excisionase family DNA binding protein
VTLTLHEVADRLGVHYMTVYRWVRTGRLPATKAGATWSVREQDLERLGAEPEPPRGRGRRIDHVARLTDRLMAGDEPGALAVAEAAMAGGMSAEDLYLEVLGPAMAKVGESWEEGEAGVAEEHRATAIVYRLLGRLAPRFGRRGRRRGTIVLGAVAGEQHGLPVALLADPLRGRGYHVVDLGANTPPEAFVDAARGADRLVAVGLSATVPADRVLRATVGALRRAGVTARLVVGGAAVADAAHADRLGADAHADGGLVALEALAG